MDVDVGVEVGRGAHRGQDVPYQREIATQMDNRARKSTSDLEANHRQRGFTLIETMVVVAMSMTLLAISIVQLQPTIKIFQARSGTDQLKTLLRQAREMAISDRRTVVVKFTGTNTVSFFLVNEPTNIVSTTAFLSVPLQANLQFGTITGENDTPDAFGLPGTGGIEFGGISGGPTTGMQFQSDGTFTDGSGNPINGTVFVARPGVTTTAGAVTILGNTGRVRRYYYSTTGWFK
jgi:prepilin-type N-terminal cleavage/methylation domain-containing protein